MFGSRTPAKLLVELAGVLLVGGTVAFLVWWFNRGPQIHNVRPLGGPNLNVSRDERAQWSPSAALDPASPRVLLAGAIDQLQDTRVFTSEDGGASWRTTPGPPLLRANCGRGDPAVAIGTGGLQLVAFLATFDCRPLDPHLHVGVRTGASGRWRITEVAPARRGQFVFDQRPSLVAGRGGAIVAWLRFVGATGGDEQRVLVSRSGDVVTWSAPVRLQFQAPFLASLALAGNGEVYLAVADASQGLVVLRSGDGGRSFGAPHRVAELPGIFMPVCGHGSVLLPAQPQRCVGPSPSISVGGSRVFVTFSQPKPDGTQGVFTAVLDRSLRVLHVGRVGPRDEHSADQFTPVSALDSSTGQLWACYYDTTGDPTRKHAWFTCTVSADGGITWAPPVHAASARSNATRFGAVNDGYGDVQGLVVAAGAAHPIWTDSRVLGRAEEIYTARLSAASLLRRRR